MTAPPHDPVEALEHLGEVIRATAPPAGADEIGHQGLVRSARAVGASGATLLLREPPAGAPVVAARHGGGSAPAMDRLGLQAIETAQAVVEDASKGRWIFRLAQPLPGGAGALVFERKSVWDPTSRAFVRSAAHVLGCALSAARSLAASRQQGEMLVRRNIELEIIRELAARLHQLGDEEELLQGALDLVLTKLGLQAGWIFRGDGGASGGRLELVASHGVSSTFLRQARESGIGDCLCQDVFSSGRLSVARNTMDCPRLPDLVGRDGPTGHACIPLRFDRGVLGVMNVAQRPGQPFTPEELQFLETIGHQICLAVDKVRTACAESRGHAETREALVRLHQAQDGMMRAERLAAVGTLAASLAHEVRNPLNSIHLQLVLLGRRVKRLDPAAEAELSSLIESAQREITRLDTLVAEFLSLSSMDRLVLAETDAAQVVREVLALMAPVAGQGGVLIESDLDLALSPIRIDQEKIKQVLINLVRNAIEAMPRGGTLRLSVHRAPGSIVIGVADTGSGIEPGLDVFAFFATTKRAGTGLGLPIARRIVEAHGGSLSYESQLGRGTRFSIKLTAPDESLSGEDPIQ